MRGQPPEGEDKREFRLIEGALPDIVVAAQRWCEAHPGTRIEFTDGWYYCYRGSVVLATAFTLSSLLDKLERLPDEGGEPQ
jgi:hypothetical protein